MKNTCSVRGGGTLEADNFGMRVCVSITSGILPWLLLQQQDIFFLPWLTAAV